MVTAAVFCGTESGLHGDSFALFLSRRRFYTCGFCYRVEKLEQLVGMKLYAADLNFDSIAEEFSVQVPFPPEVEKEAEQLTDAYADSRVDRRDLEMVTIDPVGSMDLDQAVRIERTETGYVVYYAIADVAAFVGGDSLVAQESRNRGQTIYLPDEPARLHPAPLSEGAASLLPDVDRPAVLWRISLDSSGEIVDVKLERALVHSVARLDYETAEADMESGTLHPAIELLPEVGQLRQKTALRVKAINLRTPSQRVGRDDDGHAVLELEPRLKMMDYNSEISLLTGKAAGQMMAKAGKGILRTLKPAEQEDIDNFTQLVRALGYEVDSFTAENVGAFIASVEAVDPKGQAVMREAQKLLRGSGYESLSAPATEDQVHAGVGGHYSHVTAPLRRLVDRYATEYCLHLANGSDLPAWVTEQTDEVIEAMKRTGSIAGNVDRAALDLTEAVVLEPWIGTNYEAYVLETNQKRETARLFIEHPPVFANCVGAPPAGTITTVTLTKADPEAREVEFAWPAD